jgi:hypothetical protein
MGRQIVQDYDVARPKSRSQLSNEGTDEELAFAAARLKRERAAELMNLDRIDVGARAKPSGSPRELRGGPWLTAHAREREEERLRSFWDRP